ncbi:carbon storage regulator [Alienimonas sp. DA493]|uniref:carbon storage regulator n=1 Tax=Alienimonas sp. DA493 TaxID=3373605 RepID=UPI0037541EA7
MLLLTRKTGEEILIGDSIRVSIQRTATGHVRVGIEAPKEVRIARGELAEPPLAAKPR